MIHRHGVPVSVPGNDDDPHVEDACPACTCPGVVAEIFGERSKFLYYLGPKQDKSGQVLLRVKKMLLLDEEENELSNEEGKILKKNNNLFSLFDGLNEKVCILGVSSPPSPPGRELFKLFLLFVLYALFPPFYNLILHFVS